MDYYFLMIDGPDYSGKDIALDTVAKWFSNKGERVFNLEEFWKENNGEYPRKIDASIIRSTEPTYSRYGKIIRSWFVWREEDFTSEELAQAFALDRSILYRKILVPQLKNKVKIVRSRGISTSLTYQIVQFEKRGQKITRDFVLSIFGNKLALEYPPSHLLIMYADNAEILMKRGRGRIEKRDEAFFENKKTLEELTQEYFNPEFKSIFEKLGTKIIYYNNSSDDLNTLEEDIIKLMNNELAPKTKEGIVLQEG